MMQLALAALAWQSAPAVRPRPALAVRSAPPSMNLLERPVEILIYAPLVAFVGGWAAALAPGQLGESFRKSDFMQSGKKLRTVKKEAPRLKGVALSAEATEITRTFKSNPATDDLEVLWSALLECYGSPALALEAARTNPQILNPAYSFCNTMLESKSQLLAKMGEDEALEVMRLNPAVLQCGPTLEDLGTSEIKGFAYARNAGNRLVPPAARPVLLGGLVAILLITLAGQNSSDQAPELVAILDVLRPILGLVLGGSFLFTVYAAAKAN